MEPRPDASEPRTRQLEAYSFASRFPLRELPGWLGEPATWRASKWEAVAELTEGGTVFVFDFGALVLVDVAAPTRERLIAACMRHLPREPHAPLRDDFLIELRPGQAAIEVASDRLIVAELPPIWLATVATVLAQSVCIDYYDEDLEHILDRVGQIGGEIGQAGKPRGRMRDLVRFVGSTIASQVEMVSSIALLDKPDSAWDDEAVERLYDRLRAHLEIHERYKALEAKLTLIREALSAFLELRSTRRALWLEASIVALIVFEIVLTFVR
jgi:uncharacterized Rmd1/YagE family protein